MPVRHRRVVRTLEADEPLLAVIVRVAIALTDAATRCCTAEASSSPVRYYRHSTAIRDALTDVGGLKRVIVVAIEEKALVPVSIYLSASASVERARRQRRAPPLFSSLLTVAEISCPPPRQARSPLQGTVREAA